MQNLFPFIELRLTLRCNMRCRNCIRGCNCEEVMGVKYGPESDMTLGQIRELVRQLQGIAKTIAWSDKRVAEFVNISGGEPLLHPHVEWVFWLLYEALVVPGVVERLSVNSNLTLEPPASLRPYIVNVIPPAEKARRHLQVFTGPEALGYARGNWQQCPHSSHKRVPEVTFQGVSLCCGAGGLISMFGRGDLMLDRVPWGVAEFPDIDEMCAVCTGFHSLGEIPPEETVGRPVSPLFAEQGRLNAAGRQITKRFPEIR